MEWTKESYIVPQALIKKVSEALRDNWFYSLEDGDQDNNDQIIAASEELDKCIDDQE